MVHFILGFSTALLLWLVLFNSPVTSPQTPQSLRAPAIPNHLPPAPEYEWSPNFTYLAYQHLVEGSSTSTINIWNQNTQSITQVAEINSDEHWLSYGEVDLAWLNTSTLAYSGIITDDSLPSWHIIFGDHRTSTLWQNRGLIAFSPNQQALLTVVSAGPVPSESLLYEIVLANNQVIPTRINAKTNTCSWIEKSTLKCYYTSSENKRIDFKITVSTP